jgi:aspartate/methionine/tyrosine aminotransferase
MAVLPDFRLEAYLAQWEFAARYHMTASDAESISLAELLKLAEPSDREAFEQLWLGYLPPAGSEALRDSIASTYTAVSSDNVLVFAGGGEAIYAALHALLQPDDHAIVITPTYQSLETVALSLSKITGIALDADSGWKLDLNEVRDAVRSNSKLIAINFPNNPTGKVLPLAEFDQLVEICREHGLWLLSDEVYRLSERPLSRTLPAAVDRYERGLSLSVVSKVYGLPGLRIGWIASQDRDLLQRMERIKHYLSICNASPSETLAVIALKAGARLLDRNRALIEANLKCVEKFFAEFPDLFEWNDPDGGMVAYPRYKGTDGVEKFTQHLIAEANVLLLPASIFQSEVTSLPQDRFRIGYGRSYVPAGLDAMRDWLAKQKLRYDK